MPLSPVSMGLCMYGFDVNLLSNVMKYSSFLWTLIVAFTSPLETLNFLLSGDSPRLGITPMHRRGFSPTRYHYKQALAVP